MIKVFKNSNLFIHNIMSNEIPETPDNIQNIENMENIVHSFVEQFNENKQDSEDDSDPEYSDEEDENNLHDILSTFLLDTDKTRNLVDVCIEIRDAFTIQNKLLKKLLDEYKNKK